MKSTLLAFTTLLVLALPAFAVQYKTLTEDSSTFAVSSTDLVEIVGTSMNNNQEASALRLTFADNPSNPVEIILRGKEGGSQALSNFDDMKGNVFTGLNSVQLLTSNNNANIALTIKITSAEEISVASAGTVLVVPDSTTGDLVVLTESSDDLVNWSPFISQTITAGSDPKFYRTRIIKNVSP